MKRSIRYAALVMAAAMALSACSNNSETTETEASPELTVSLSFLRFSAVINHPLNQLCLSVIPEPDTS